MESETETENYKNTSMPPSARLEENKKKEPFSSAAAGSLSAVITGTSSPECAILAGSQSSVSQAGLNTHREAQAGAARRREGQPLRGSPLGTQALGLFWGMAPRTARVALSSETHGIVPAGPRAALPLSHLTPFSLKTSPLPHCHPGPAFFPRHDLKGTEGQPRGAGLLAPCPCVQCPSLLSSSRPRPRAGLPHLLAPGPPAIIPPLLQRTSCLWVHPHQPGRHVLSLLSPSNRTRGTSRFLLQGSLQRPLRVSESSLGVASMVPLPARSPLLCQQAVSPALQGNSPGARGTRVTKPLPFLALPHATPRPQHVSPWAPGPALPAVIPQSLAPLLNLGMQDAPQPYPCTPSLSTGTRLVTLLCSCL